MKKLLFVCTLNKMRSATAHKMYENDTRFEVKSAGILQAAHTVISAEMLNWADCVMVMEKHHHNFIQYKFADICPHKKIITLDIPDDYEYMQTELIQILKNKVEGIFTQKLI